MEHFKVTFLEIYRKNLGVISVTCQKRNISRQTYYDWMKNDPEFKKAVLDADEETIDWAEGKLLQSIDGGNPKSISYFLDAKARARGYGAKLEIQHAGAIAQPKIEVVTDLANQFTEEWLKRERQRLEDLKTPEQKNNESDKQ